MRWVVDTNMLASPELGGYLTRTKNFYAVICDAVAIETYQARDIIELRKNFSVLRTAPKRVILLKDGLSCLRMSGREAGLSRRLVDQPTTNEFSSFCQNLYANDKLANRLLSQKRKEAIEHLDGIEEFSTKLPAIVKDLMGYFTESELRTFRRRETMSKEAIEKIIVFCRDVSDQVNRKHGGHVARNMAEWINSFATRAMLSNFINILNWLRKGRSTDETKHNPRRTRNDNMDAMIAVYASYFDGLLSDDEGANRTHAELRVIIDNIKALA